MTSATNHPERLERDDTALQLLRYGLLIVFLAACGCSSPKRYSDSDDAPDAGTGGDTGLPWDGGNDDFQVAQPGFLTTEGRSPTLGFDGEKLAVAWSDDEIETEEAFYHTLFFTFPWSKPEMAQWDSFPQEPPACHASYSWNGPVSKPYPIDGGFFLLTSTVGDDNESCQVVRSLWSLDAVILDGPDTWSDIYPKEKYHVMSSFGVQDPEGTVVVGNLKCVGCGASDEPGSEEVVFQIDRFGPYGLHESLLKETFDWSEQAPETGHVFSGYGGQNAFVHEGVVTVVGLGAEGQVVLARGTLDGQVIQPPEIVIPIPDPEEGPTATVSSRSFAQHDGELLVMAKLNHCESEDQNPFPVELVSYVLGMDGEILHGPTPLAIYDSHVHADLPMVAWSGQHFGVCYREPFDTFKFIALGEDGELERDPVPLFWAIPPVENKLSPCDVIAIDEDTFAVALRVYTNANVAYQNGTYITYLTTLFVE